MRYWLLTSTFYGNWLSGDPRGFVSRVREERPEDAPDSARHEHDVPGTPYDEDMPGLHQHAQESLKCPPIRTNLEQAKVLLAQFQETAAYRHWQLLAVAIMPDHIHIVFQVEDDPDPTKVLGDFKAYGSRALNERWGKPVSGTWWTYDGSKRKLPDDRALRAAIHYVLFKQPNPLLTWAPGERGCVSAPSATAPSENSQVAPASEPEAPP